MDSGGRETTVSCRNVLVSALRTLLHTEAVTSNDISWVMHQHRSTTQKARCQHRVPAPVA